MADPIVGATVQFLLEKALSLAIDRIGLVLGFQDELVNLRQSVFMIQAVLADAESKKSHNNPVQLWLQRLEGVAFEADHLLDELHYETLRRKVAENRNSQLKGNKVCYFSFSFSFSRTNIAFRWRMASKIRDINIKLKKVNQEAHDLGLITRYQIEAVLPPTTAGVTESRQTHSIASPNAVGRVNDESRLVKMLLSSSEEVVSVIPIVGMGGLGKTTLAKSVYNNPKIDSHFGKKIWVYVSEDFAEMRLFKLILESLTGVKVQLSSKDAVVQKIRKELEGTRYLLVLDDVWNENQKLWDDFFDFLAGLVPVDGSKCLVTTRLEQVASIVSTHPPYLLGKLSGDDCWSIVKGKALAGVEALHELNIMREQILKKCDGLPLAASVLGGLLRIKRKEEWLSVAEKKLLNLRENENSIMQILKLSFDNLPSASIKKCFAYCSIFAKDEEMERELLIELWMAEGFLQLDPNKQSTMEDIGDLYIRTLLQSSLLEEAKYRREICYKMHDLVHDLAESISNPGDNHNQFRCLTLNSSDNMSRKDLKDISTSVRTLFLKRGLSSEELSKFKNLHVLNLSAADLKDLPASIGKLIHLRFLTVCKLKTLPESVCELYSLQTLRIQSLDDLPKGMSDLISLRHLHYYTYNGNFQMPLEMGRLTCLQTLRFFNVGKEKGRLIEELQYLKDLKGNLEIRNLELVNGKEGAERANLSGKPNLLGLEFVWNWNREGANCGEQVLEGLKPHSNLQKLAVTRFMGDEFPQWLMNLSACLDKLVELRLTRCKRCREIPAALGQLPFLQNLEFRELDEIRRIGPSFYGMDDDFRRGGGEGSGSTISSRKLFPALRTLTLKNMGNLVEWMEPKEAADMLFPMLEKLIIDHCSQLVDAPSHFPNLQKLEIIGNDHVAVVKKILCKVINLSSLKISGKTGLTGLTCISEVTPTLLNINFHQNLKSLKLEKCTDLANLRGCGNSIESLHLVHCDNLRGLLEHTCQFQSLRNLEIKGCPRFNLEGAIIPNDNLGQQSILTSLERLTISGCDGLTSVPNKMLESSTSLLVLIVHDCPNLISFPMIESLHQSPRLLSLGLYNCPKLMTIPKGFGSRSRLRHLSVGHKSFNNNQFDWSGLIHSSTLRSLSLYGTPHMDSLPDQLQYLTNLPSLCVSEFGGMEALPDWIGNLVSLWRLELRGCDKLRYFPSEAAMRRLTKLNLLRVCNCPLLKERCSPRSSPDSEWSKISHILELDIR